MLFRHIALSHLNGHSVVRPAFRPSTLFVCPEPYLSNYWSVTIGQIWFILGTNDKYHGLSISYKFG